MHKKLKPYKFKFCDASFGGQYVLKRHIGSAHMDVCAKDDQEKKWIHKLNFFQNSGANISQKNQNYSPVQILKKKVTISQDIWNEISLNSVFILFWNV